MKIHSIVHAIALLLFVACARPVTSEQGLAASVSTITPSPTATPLAAATLSAPIIQLTHPVDIPELGIGVALPSDWSIVNQPGVVLAGPGLTPNNSIERTWLHLGFNTDVPQALPELTKVMAESMRTQGHISDLTTTRVVISKSEGIAIWWTQPVPRDPSQPEHWVSIYVPAHGLVHQIVFHPILLAQDGKQLKAVGQAILDSVKFFPAARSAIFAQPTPAS